MSDYGQTTPADIGGSLDYDPSSSIYTSDLSGDWFSAYSAAGYDMGGTTTEGNYLAYIQDIIPASNDQMNAIADANSGVAGALKETETGMFDGFMKWFLDDKTGVKGQAAIALGGSFLKGMMEGVWGADAAKTKSKNETKIANAAELRAKTDADVAARKFSNAGSIAQTNFGAAPQGLIFSNKLAERQKRAGYGG